jgi:biotin operon repressor
MEAGNESSGKNTQETTLSGDRLGDRLGENRIKILTAMKNHPTISIPDLSKQIGISTTAIF